MLRIAALSFLEIYAGGGLQEALREFDAAAQLGDLAGEKNARAIRGHQLNQPSRSEF